MPLICYFIVQDVKNLKGRRVCVFTDKNLVDEAPVKTVLDSITNHNRGRGIHVDVYDQVRVEPTGSRYVQFNLKSTTVFSVVY